MSTLSAIRDYLASRGLIPLQTARSRRGAQLRIEFVSDEDGNCAIRLRSQRGNKPVTLNALPWTQVAAARDNLADHLYDFVRTVKRDIDAPPDWRVLNEGLARLNIRSRALMFTLLTQEGGERLDATLRGLFPLTASAEPPATVTPALIELQSPEDYVHFEGLPLIGSDDIPVVTDQRRFRMAMWRLFGMFASIRRTSRVTGPLDTALIAADRLPIKMFYDASLNGAQQEASFFQDLRERVDLQGPWPDCVQALSNSSSVAALLLDPDRNFNGSPRRNRDQILHFSCHCITHETDPNRYRLRLQAPTGESLELTLEELEAAFYSHAKRRPVPPVSRPLVVLNVCGSAEIDPRRLGSFPNLFRATHRGMIGTETKVPDDVAAAFSRAFYTALLNRKTVGESLHAARWALVNRFHSPLGILYTLHADPDLSVSLSQGGDDT